MILRLLLSGWTGQSNFLRIIDNLLITVYNEDTNFKEENTMIENRAVLEEEEIEVAEPDWSITMFWEDITSIFLKIIEFFSSIARYF